MIMRRSTRMTWRGTLEQYLALEEEDDDEPGTQSFRGPSDRFFSRGNSGSVARDVMTL